MIKSRMIIVSLCLVFLTLIVVPATAADNTSDMDSVEIRQAHLSWTALDKDVEMNAAVTYCGTLYGSDTTTMNRLLSEFRAEEARIPETSTPKEVDALIAEMRNTTAQFRSETYAVMTKGQGKWDALSSQIFLVKENNPYLLEKKEYYWAVRTADQLAAFDAWVQDGQQHLDMLKAGGYDTTSAQRALDVFSSKRPDVKAALTQKTELAVNSVYQQIRPLSLDFGQKLEDVQGQVPDTTRFLFFIEQADRAVGKADTVNNALLPILLDIGSAETVLSKTKNDLKEARKLLGTGNLGNTKTPLRLVKKDLTDLAQAYRDIVHTAALTPDLSMELNTLAIRLDNTADQMGAVL